MCGRYELHTHPAALALAFGLEYPPSIRPRFNIAPMQEVPVIRLATSGVRELAQVRWGLVPRWAKDPSIGNRMINARAETLAQKPSFRTAFQKHRCLIPADGFYEWKQALAGGKQPIHVGMKDRRPFAFAGLTERWLSPEGEVLDTCTIVTTTANALLAAMHDRMPVIVAPADYTRWLDVACADVTDLLAPYPAEAMTWYPVSTRVNSVRNDDATLIVQVAETDAMPSGDAPPPPADSDDHAAEDEGAAPEQARLF
jgi:putative SOS response-associated peptidase YedK